MIERPPRYLVRPIAPAGGEVELVAERMRQTLVEVLGEERGVAMYSIAWLRERVRFHLDGARCTGEVFVVEDATGAIVGHSIVRLEVEGETGRTVGLFSTTYVVPEHRRYGVATLLLGRGEAWMRAHRLATAVTFTDEGNVRLIRLYEKHGYRVVETKNQMVKIEKAIDRPDHAG